MLSSSDHLPDHIKQAAVWGIRGPYIGYIVFDPILQDLIPIEFIDGHWYKLFVTTGGKYITALEDQFALGHLGTGHWQITDPEHPDYTPPTAHSTEAQRTAEELVFPIAGPSTLNLELLITPRRCPQPLDSPEVTEGTSPLVGIPLTPHSD